MPWGAVRDRPESSGPSRELEVTECLIIPELAQGNIEEVVQRS